MMSDPRISALVCLVAAAWIGYLIFFAAQPTSPWLGWAQWGFFILALLGLVAAVLRLLRERR